MTGSEDVDASCSSVETWVGTILGWASMLLLLFITRIFAIILFSIALFKISLLLSKLKKFGYVSNTCMLRIHIFVASLDMVCSILAAWITINLTIDAFNSVKPAPEDFATSLIIQRTYDFSNQLTMLMIAHMVNKYYSQG